ncbi:MAG TPA: hypothetical protein VL551_29960 [Actinospica sp.]|nr:hypothetical protein [Actinospica sp.]
MTNRPDPDAFDPFRTTDPETAARDVPADEFDPFRITDPPTAVRDMNQAEFDPFWNGRTGDTRCPECGTGTPTGHGVAPSNQRPWIRYSCGHVVAGRKV